jgi:hypothetical protein
MWVGVSTTIVCLRKKARRLLLIQLGKDWIVSDLKY